MVHLYSALLALAAVSTVSGGLVPPSRLFKHAIIARKGKPPTYDESYLEPYQQYHARYLALDCEDKHGQGFFDECCHPMLANQTLENARPQECNPSTAASSSAALAEPTSTVTTPADDGTDSSSSSSAPQPSNTPSTKSDVKQNPPPPPPPPPSPSPSPKPSSQGGSGGGGGDSGDITGGVATFFYQNGIAGACGKVNSDSALICAMDSARYGNGELCGKEVEITNTQNGKSVTVVVADECPTCENGNSIDLSTGAFKQIADPSAGEVPIAWHFS